jgi:integrase
LDFEGIMSVRKRIWTTRDYVDADGHKHSGEIKEAWIVDYVDQDGRRHVKTFPKKKEAVDHAQQIGVDVRAGIHTPASKSITVAQAADEWITFIKGEGRERSTREQYQQHARHINARLGSKKLSSLTVPGINAFRDDLVATMKRPMARKVLTSLKSLLSNAQRVGNVAQNVALSVKIGVNKREAKRKLQVGVDIPTPDEIRLILSKASGPRQRALLMTTVFTGIRASELRGLRWSDVDLKTGKLQVRQRADRYLVIGKPKSVTSERTIPLPPPVLNILKTWKLACPKNSQGLVFPTRKGHIEQHSNIVRALQRMVIAAGLTVPKRDQQGTAVTNKKGVPVVKAKYTGLHALRHFYASWCINQRKDGGLELPAKKVQERLGHATIGMTMDTYGHLFPSNDDGSELEAAALALIG